MVNWMSKSQFVLKGIDYVLSVARLTSSFQVKLDWGEGKKPGCGLSHLLSNLYMDYAVFLQKNPPINPKSIGQLEEWLKLEKAERNHLDENPHLM